MKILEKSTKAQKRKTKKEKNYLLKGEHLLWQ
jgi:hypothetical protein